MKKSLVRTTQMPTVSGLVAVVVSSCAPSERAHLNTATNGRPLFCSRETFSRQENAANEIRGYNPAVAERWRDWRGQLVEKLNSSMPPLNCHAVA